MHNPFLLREESNPSRRPIRAARPWLVGGLLIVAATLSSCGGPLLGPTGTLRINVSTTLQGEFDVMPTEYTVLVRDISGASDNQQEKGVDANGSVDFSGIGVGFDIRVRFTGAPPGCMSSAWIFDTKVTQAFKQESVSVICWMGSMNVRVETLGPSPDADGYELVLDDDRTLPVAPGAVASAVFNRVIAGPHDVRLSGVAANCTTSPPRQTVSLSSTSGDIDVDFLVTCVPPGGAMPQTVWEDDFTDGSMWTEVVAWANGGATSTVETRAAGGNAGGYRHMEHLLPGSGAIGVNHWYTGGSYDPSVDGAIQEIDYRASRIQFDPPFATAAIGALFIVEQGGAIYWSPVDGSASYTNLNWLDATALSLVAADFSPAGLDFSGAGGEMRFGFRRSNTNNGAVPIATTHGIDNWRVEVIR